MTKIQFNNLGSLAYKNSSVGTR